MVALSAVIAAIALANGGAATPLPDTFTDWTSVTIALLLSYMLASLLLGQFKYHNRSVCERCDRRGRVEASKGRFGPVTVGQWLFHTRDSDLLMALMFGVLLAAMVGLWLMPWTGIVALLLLAASYYAFLHHQVRARSCGLCWSVEKVFLRRRKDGTWAGTSMFAATYHTTTRGATGVLLRCNRNRDWCDAQELVRSWEEACEWVYEHAAAQCTPGDRLAFTLNPNVPLSALESTSKETR